ncbi:Transposase [compost metagenome]
MSISQLMLTSNDEEPARRFEVFTRSGRRREWSDERKAQIVAERYEPGVTVCTVARRHGLTPQQLFTWRRLARKPLEAVPVVEDVPMFAPAVQDMPTKAVAKECEPARIEKEVEQRRNRIGDWRGDREDRVRRGRSHDCRPHPA